MASIHKLQHVWHAAWIAGAYLRRRSRKNAQRFATGDGNTKLVERCIGSDWQSISQLILAALACHADGDSYYEE